LGYFDDKNNVDEYIKMADGYDGRELIDRLIHYLKPGSSVLELGMGPGKDLDILLEKYQATGSDSSTIFLDMYKKKAPNFKLLQLNAITLETDQKFDCLYSNKVLHHLSSEELKFSIKKQPDLLNERGIIMHTFWAGEGEEFYNGLRFVYYTQQELTELFQKHFSILENSLYKEEKKDDSIRLIVQKK
jgi:trans-aconitate methyltransferase